MTSSLEIYDRIWIALTNYSVGRDVLLVRSHELGGAPGGLFIVDRAAGKTVVMSLREVDHHAAEVAAHLAAKSSVHLPTNGD
jgi:hypothetical protein